MSLAFIYIDNVLKNMQSTHKLNQEILSNGLDKYVIYVFNDIDICKDTAFIKIGKKLTSKQAEKEGIFIDSLDRGVYEFDYNNTTEVEYAAKKIVDVCDKILSNADDITIQRIKQIAAIEVKNQLSELMSKILTSKPNCISSSNKILLCDYYESPEANYNLNLRLVIDIDDRKIKLDKKGNLVFYIPVDFKLPVREVNPKYNNAVNQTSGNAYERVKGKLKIEIPLI